jgi:hypothetical protein
MEKGFSMEFSDKEIEDLKKELYKKETMRQLREMSKEQLDVVYDELQIKLGEVIITSEYINKQLDTLEKNFNLLTEFIDEYMTPVYLEEHGIDIRDEDNGSETEI